MSDGEVESVACAGLATRIAAREVSDVGGEVGALVEEVSYGVVFAASGGVDETGAAIFADVVAVQ